MKCQGFSCECDSEEAEVYRMNTNYLEDSRNYMTLCECCQEESHEYWAEQWREYYSNCI